jgi:Mce-associated membrane protein
LPTNGPDPIGTADELAREAEAQALAAEARADAARARAAELRRELDATDAPDVVPTDVVPTDVVPTDVAPTDIPLAASPPPAPPAGLLRTVAVAVTTLLTAGLLGATGYMVWQHQKAAELRRSAAEFTAAARQDVINLMSMDYTRAQESVQRVLDNSTGKFRANFDETADEFVKALQDEKIVTTATINDAAVELDSMTDESAVVMVSATSRREGRQAPKEQQQPQVWRVVLTLEREGDQIKMSGVEFV